MTEVDSNKKRWQGKTGGGDFGQRFLFWFLRRVNVRFLYPVLYLVIPFYLIFARQGRVETYRFFRRRMGYSVMRSVCCTCRNHLVFGRVVLDKFALIAGRSDQFKVSVEGLECVDRLLDSNQGFILVSAHIGNFEMAAHCLNQKMTQIYSVVYAGENEDFQRRRAETFGRSHVGMIPVASDMSHLFMIKQVLEENSVVSILCDRVFGSPKTILCDFLGASARFPTSSFRLAAQLNVPVVCLFIMKGKGACYYGYASSLTVSDEQLNSVKKADLLTRQYVEQLEKIVRRYPEQWFNYFPFWEED